jgi:molybdopterin biosynthesis enzyme MoaB
MLPNDTNLRFDIEKAKACLTVGGTGIGEEEIVAKELVQ